MKKVIVVALGLMVAVLGFGSLNAPASHADPTAVYAIGCEFLIGAIDGDTDDASTPLGADGTAACNGIDETGDNPLSTAVETGGESETLEEVLGDGDGIWEAGELDDVEFDANQIADGAAPLPGGLYLVILVNDGGDVTIDPKALGADQLCSTNTLVPPVADEDCDGDATLNDGAVFTAIGDATGAGGSLDAGDTVDVDVAQDGIELSISINVVGLADEIVVTALKTTVETLSATDACDDIAITDGLDANADVDKVLLIATVTDSEDTDLARVGVTWESDDTDVLDLAEDERAAGGGSAPTAAGSVDTTTGVSVDDDGTVVAAAVFCGQDDPGTATVTAEFDQTSITGGQAEDDSVEITVVGEPASVALTASPAAIPCDGSATSTVSATVTDADGNNVADGTSVNFSVVALGTANPVNADTAAGVATSVITPLSGATAGVTVVVSAGDAQASIRIDCLLSLLTPTAPPPAVSPTPPTGIGGPDTGNGGYLGQDSSSGFPMWTLVALALGSLALFGGGLVARRAGK